MSNAELLTSSVQREDDPLQEMIRRYRVSLDLSPPEEPNRWIAGGGLTVLSTKLLRQKFRTITLSYGQEFIRGLRILNINTNTEINTASQNMVYMDQKCLVDNFIFMEDYIVNDWIGRDGDVEGAGTRLSRMIFKMLMLDSGIFVLFTDTKGIDPELFGDFIRSQFAGSQEIGLILEPHLGYATAQWGPTLNDRPFEIGIEWQDTAARFGTKS